MLFFEPASEASRAAARASRERIARWFCRWAGARGPGRWR